MKPLPIRRQVALWTAAFSATVLLLFATGTLWNLYEEQLEAIDVDIEQSMLLLREIGSTTAMVDAVDHINAEHPWMGAAVLNADGSRLENNRRLPDALLTQASAATANLRIDDQHWRVALDRRPDSTLVVAHDLVEADEIIRELIAAYGVSLPLVLAAVGFGGWWVAGRALAPVQDLTRAIEAIEANRLDSRVTPSLVDDEIGRLRRGFNAMLERLERAFQQAQRFAADASHELRTPLTVMRAEVERGLRDRALGPAQIKRLLSLQEEISYLERITETLLLLATLDSGNAGVQREVVKFSELARETAEDGELLAEAEHIQFEAHIAPDVTVEGDPALLRRLLLNLLQNAIRHNQPEGWARIDVELKTGNGPAAVRVCVANTGPGIPPELRDRVFERFFQVDSSRGERSGHGLGLDLSREIARAHGGTLELAPGSRTGWTEFRFTMPCQE